MKFIVAASALFAAVTRLSPVASAVQQRQGPDALLESSVEKNSHRRLQSVDSNAVPSYMQPMMKDLAERKKLFADTPPEEVKYWFEYTGPLQVSLYLYTSIYVLVAIHLWIFLVGKGRIPF
jgi:hypothetical protein